MSIYVDTSACAKRYLDEPERPVVLKLLRADPDVVTARHTFVEMHRALTRDVSEADRLRITEAFRSDWARFQIVELDEIVCRRAADLVVTLGVRTLDALHLAAAHRVGAGALPFLTCDLRQAQAARSLGWTVLGT